jgi:hypothetical protein
MLFVDLRPSRLRRAAVAALAAAIAVVPPAWAFRDCCFVYSVPPMVSGVFVPAASVWDGYERAARLGFWIDSTPDQGEARAGLDRGFIGWRPGPMSSDYDGIPAPGGFPVVAGAFYEACGNPVVPDRPTFSRRGATHPNGAIAVTGIIAVVADLDAACASASGSMPEDPRWRAAFERPRVLASLGALSRTAATSDGSTITLLAPLDTNGRAARWLADGGPRWLGVAITVDDLDRTAALLDRNQVAYERMEIEGLPHVIVPLAEGDRSLLAFFVPASSRRAYDLP